MQNIPSIAFNSKMPNISGIEIFPLERIIELTKTTSHESYNPHRLNFYMLAFYTSGSGQQQVDFKWHKAQKNCLLYLSKGQVNAFKFSENSKGFCLVFTQEYFEKCFGNLSTEFISRLFSPHVYSPLVEVPIESDLQNYFELLNIEFYHNQTYNKERIISSMFTVLMIKFEQLLQVKTTPIADSSKFKVFTKFATLLEEQFARNRNADFYAFSIGVSYKHLNTICKELINKTAKQFIDNYIILEAKRQLINSDIKSTELAFSMGFEEPTNFVKYFKKHTGLTPNKFKNSFN